MAGVPVFHDAMEQAGSEPVYIASFAARLRDMTTNAFNSTRFYGAFVTPQANYIIFYVDDTGVFYQNEIRVFNNFVGTAGFKDTSIILMGESTHSIGANIFSVKNEVKKKYFSPDSFARIYEDTTLPVMLVPIGETGAQILRLLMIPQYREELAKALLKKMYRPPYKGMNETDAVYYKEPHNPAVIAVDMNVKRLDYALETAKAAGYSNLTYFALLEQVPFLVSRYHIEDKENIMAINIAGLVNDMAHNIALHKPSRRPFITKEGEFLDVTRLEDYRKAGKSARP